MASPSSLKGRDTRLRLEKCWEEDIKWDLYPSVLREVKLFNAILDCVSECLPACVSDISF